MCGVVLSLAFIYRLLMFSIIFTPILCYFFFVFSTVFSLAFIYFFSMLFVIFSLAFCYLLRLLSLLINLISLSLWLISFKSSGSSSFTMQSSKIQLKQSLLHCIDNTSHYNFMYSFAFRPFGFSIALFVVYLRAKSLIDYLFHQLFCLFAKMFCYI